MTDKTLQLTDYQQATLTEMGIMLWRQSNLQPQDADTAIVTEKTPPSAPVGQLPDAIAKFKKTDGAPNSKAVAAAKTLNNKVLVTVEGVQHSNLLSDLLQALNLDEEGVAYFPAQPLSAFSDYQFAWQTGDKVGLNDNVLSTPSKLSAQAKKALWALLSQDAN